MVACRFFDRWFALTGQKIEHMHYTRAEDGSQRVEGREVEGLVPGRRVRPDGYSAETKTVWLFHGNYYHGYPPDDPRHETAIGVGSQSAAMLFEATTLNMQLYSKRGFVVKYVWEHEYYQTEKASCPRRLSDVVRVQA